MIDPKICQQELKLRKRVELLLRGRAKHRKNLTRIVNELRGCRLPAFIFGGTLRDLMIYKGPLILRDLDIVVENLNSAEFDSFFIRHQSVKNRFGGYHLNVEGWKFDVWALANTWAFKEKHVRNANFDSLPKTSFLNLEAIVIRIDTERFKVRELFSSGFFEALLEKKLEINLEENPFPINCVMRSLTLAKRFNFSLGPHLTKYILEYGKKSSPEELAYLHWRHYKRATYSPSDFARWLSEIGHQFRTGVKNVQIPGGTVQPELLEDGIQPSRNRIRSRVAKPWYQWKSGNLWEC
jgi:hypothetical protein